LKKRVQNNDRMDTSWKEYGIDFLIPGIMGIINVTPDSFSDGGKFNSAEQAVSYAMCLEEEGADIIDIGGESSRPGADPVPEQEEINRVIPVIRGIRKSSDIPISIDTYKANVADKALEAGANWINDISGLRMDPEMIHIAGKWDCPVIVMHMKGTPRTMQENPCYDDIIEEITEYFKERIAVLLSLDIKKIILDPGIGFGKRVEDNLMILKELSRFRQLGYPLLVGTSRKSFIGEITDRPVELRIAGSITSVVWSVLNGANLVRVHDVAATKDAIKIVHNIAKVEIK
jgi:dihydropteroate synthase